MFYVCQNYYYRNYLLTYFINKKHFIDGVVNLKWQLHSDKLTLLINAVRVVVCDIIFNF